MDRNFEPTVNDSAPQPERKPYSTPTLTDFGSFAEITQGNAGNAGTDNVVYS
jgi:hypothetical protein